MINFFFLIFNKIERVMIFVEYMRLLLFFFKFYNSLILDS